MIFFSTFSSIYDDYDDDSCIIIVCKYNENITTTKDTYFFNSLIMKISKLCLIVVNIITPIINIITSNIDSNMMNKIMINNHEGYEYDEAIHDEVMISLWRQCTKYSRYITPSFLIHHNLPCNDRYNWKCLS